MPLSLIMAKSLNFKGILVYCQKFKILNVLFEYQHGYAQLRCPWNWHFRP